MTPPFDEDDINLTAKSDRELLLMLAGKLNHICHKVDRHDEALFNNGWGLAAQTRVMWGIFCILGGILVKLAVR